MTSATAPRRRRFDAAPLYKALFLTVVAAFVAVPLIATLLGGFKSLGELRTNPFGLPQVWEWENYWRHPGLEALLGAAAQFADHRFAQHRS